VKGGVGLPRGSRGRRSKPEMASLCFRRPFRDSCYAAVVELAVAYLEPTVPATACATAVVWSLSTALVLLVASYLFDHPLPFCAIVSILPPPWLGRRSLGRS
jgi:hypothetical protein